MFKIAGKNVRLRLATLDDAEPMLRAMDQSTLKNFSFFAEGRVTLERQKAYLEKMCRSEQDLLFCVERNLDRAIIGTCGLHELDGANRNARLGVMLFSAEDRGRGYGTEARQLLLTYAFRVEHSPSPRLCKPKLHKVYARFRLNDSAFRKYLSEGFNFEGVMIEEYRMTEADGTELIEGCGDDLSDKNGRYESMVSVGILRNRWEAMQRKENA